MRRDREEAVEDRLDGPLVTYRRPREVVLSSAAQTQPDPPPGLWATARVRLPRLIVASVLPPMPDLICLSPTHPLLTFDRSLPTVVCLFPQPFDEEENFRPIIVIEGGIIRRGRVTGAVENRKDYGCRGFEPVWSIFFLRNLGEELYCFIRFSLLN